MLSDKSILEMIGTDIRISNFRKEHLRSGSYLLHLGDFIGLFDRNDSVVDLKNKNSYPRLRKVSLTVEPYVLKPGEFILGGTEEGLSLSRAVSATLRNLSGLSRLGLAVEIASFVSPGFGELQEKPLTLEIRNFSPFPILLRPGIPICHVIFWRLDQLAENSYDRDERRHSMLNAPSASRYYEYFRNYDDPNGYK